MGLTLKWPRGPRPATEARREAAGLQCPQCGLPLDGPAIRCPRCNAALVVPGSCSGACSKCNSGCGLRAR